MDSYAEFIHIMWGVLDNYWFKVKVIVLRDASYQGEVLANEGQRNKDVC